MYHRFIEQISEFIFAEDEPEKADIIFIPGNGYSQMAEKAAALYGKKYSPFVLPSGKYSIAVGKFGGVLSGQERYNGKYGMGFFKRCFSEKSCSGRSNS